MPTSRSFSMTGRRAHLVLAHQVGGFVGRHLGRDADDVAADDLAYRAVELAAVGHGADDDVAIRDDADRPAVLDDRNRARVRSRA